jgi:glycosyltransferase involved in cell wall biosynthesis
MRVGGVLRPHLRGAAGCLVVSTPYYVADDLLGSGVGVLVPFEDADALSSTISGLLDDSERLATATAEARRIVAGLAWSRVASDTLEVLHEAR